MSLLAPGSSQCSYVCDHYIIGSLSFSVLSPFQERICSKPRTASSANESILRLGKTPMCECWGERGWGATLCRNATFTTNLSVSLGKFHCLDGPCLCQKESVGTRPRCGVVGALIRSGDAMIQDVVAKLTRQTIKGVSTQTTNNPTCIYPSLCSP